jgi:hypothetical protein
MMVATLDQAISTNYFKRKILKEETENNCQLCKEYEDTGHLTLESLILSTKKKLVHNKG